MNLEVSVLIVQNRELQERVNELEERISQLGGDLDGS